jgi:hypothetical protein
LRRRPTDCLLHSFYQNISLYTLLPNIDFRIEQVLIKILERRPLGWWRKYFYQKTGAPPVRVAAQVFLVKED